MNQTILPPSQDYRSLDEYFAQIGTRRLMLVCGNSINRLRLGDYFSTLRERTGIEVVRFSDYTPNPDYASVVAGVETYRKTSCDMVVAVGGGSAMDLAKCIKMYATMPDTPDYMLQTIVANDIPLLAVPTTAGTGSEATRFAVIYYQGRKQSVADESCIPTAVLIDPTVLDTLPEYHRKATMLDALCHAVESHWSVNSTDESKVYAERAIRMVMDNMDGYLKNTPEGNAGMLEAANIAGKAINITQTTAGHAMSYMLTTLYGTAHGHAVALCMTALWQYMLDHTDLCNDPRGEDYLKSVLSEIGAAMGCATAQEAATRFDELYYSLDLPDPTATEEEFLTLVNSVNPSRLKNHPVLLTPSVLEELYRSIL